MSNFKGRTRMGALPVLALGAAALLALSGLAVAKDGHHDRHHHRGPDAGTIVTFDSGSGALAIELTDGNTVSGLVTSRTEIRCEDEHVIGVAARSHGSESGDDHGSHGEEAGDDNGGRGIEPGDDNGGDSSGPSQSGPSGHDDHGAGANCTESDLIVGAVVHEAELDLRNGKAVFDEVELNG